MTNPILPKSNLYTKKPFLHKEIKFRIWHKDANRMIYNPYIDDITSRKFQINDFFNEKNNQLIWMLCSSHKDNLGNEIYEGDIVHTNSHKDYFAHANMLAIIKFEEGRFFRSGKTVLLNGISSYFDQVIGNIFENPELLELC